MGNKSVTVLWSGGFDSTALILKYLNDGYDVEALSFRLKGNNTGQVKSENRARELIYEIINSKLDQINGSRTQNFTKAAVDLPTVNWRNGIMIMPYLWLMNAAFSTSNKTIAFGYVKGDDFWHFKHAAHMALQTINAFSEDEDTPFWYEYPFEWYTKDDLLRFYNDYPEVLPYLSVTEDGKHWMTGECEKSIEMKRLYNKFNNRNAPIKAETKRKLVIPNRAIELADDCPRVLSRSVDGDFGDPVDECESDSGVQIKCASRKL